MNRDQAKRVRLAVRCTGVSRDTFCSGSNIRYTTLEQGLCKNSFTKKLTFDLADKIARRCWEYGVEVSPMWLITGEGELPSLFIPTQNDIIQPESSPTGLQGSVLDWDDVL